MNEVIEIPLSKNKLILISLGSLAFVAIGIFLIIKPNQDSNIVRIVGFLGCSFFGLCLIYAIKKMFDKENGLIINRDGIIDNSSGISIGLIEWKDIEAIESGKISSTKFLFLYTDNPEKYIARSQNTLSKQAMKANLKMYGTPLTISSTALKIKFDDLETIIYEEFERNKE